MNTAQTNLKFSNDEKQRVCQTCRKGFKSKSYLTVHKKNHSGKNRTIVIFVIRCLPIKVT